MQRVVDVYRREPHIQNILLDKYFLDVMSKNQGAWRRVVAAATGAGMPIPALSSALAYYDAYRSPRLSANLVQAQNDLFLSPDDDDDDDEYEDDD